MEFIILYHGTKFKKTVDKILQDGFSKDTYFSIDLADAIAFGGKYVFSVVFLKSEVPSNWQVRCGNSISPKRITQLSKCTMNVTFIKKKLLRKLFDDEVFIRSIKYYFFESGEMEKITKEL